MNPDKSYESNWLSWVSPLRLPYVFPSLSQYIPIYHGCSTKTDTWGNKWPTEPFWGLFKGTLLSPCRFHHFEIFTSHYSQTCHMIYCRLDPPVSDTPMPILHDIVQSSCLKAMPWSPYVSGFPILCSCRFRDGSTLNSDRGTWNGETQVLSIGSCRKEPQLTEPNEQSVYSKWFKSI